MILDLEREKSIGEEDCGGALCEATERDGTGLVRATYWRLCDAKDSCDCATICKDWGNIVEWLIPI